MSLSSFHRSHPIVPSGTATTAPASPLELEPWQRIARNLSVTHSVHCIILTINLIAISGLTGYIASRDLGLGGFLPACIALAAVGLGLTLLSKFLGGGVDGYQKRWCVGFFLWPIDFMAWGTQIGAMVTLSAGGLPWHCGRITRSDYNTGDATHDSEPDYDTIRFGDANTSGELDRLCHIPRMYWVFSLLLTISYIYVLGTSIRLIVALARRKKQHKALLDAQRLSTATPNANAVTMPQPAHPPPQFFVTTNAPLGARDVATEGDVEDIADRTVSGWSDDIDTPPVGSPPPYERDGKGKGVEEGEEKKGGY